MKILAIGLVLAAAVSVPATAETRHDRKLEQAAIDIAVAKIGGLRGSLAFDAELSRFMLPDFGPTGSVPRRVTEILPAPRWEAGLMPAVERKVSRIVF